MPNHLLKQQQVGLSMESSGFAALLPIPLTKTLCSCLLPFSANAKDLPPMNRTPFGHGCLWLRVVQFV
jgi:hypothetical protein